MDDRQKQTATESLHMLGQLLDGSTYSEIASRTGLSRTAVEKRVKTIEREVRQSGNFTPICTEPVGAKDIRRMREAYLEAMKHYSSHPAARRDGHRVVTDAEIEQAVETARSRSKCPSRDTALLYTLFGTGAKPLEIARLRVRDYLREDGSVRVESRVMTHAAVSGKPRPLFFANVKLVRAIDVYLKERVQKRQGAIAGKVYRGLDPSSRLFLTDDGKAMAVHQQIDGDRRHHRCGLILDIYRKLFERAGLKGMTTLDARRTVAKRLQDRGCNLEQIGEALGVRDRESLKKLIPKVDRPLCDLFRDLV